MAEQNQPCKIIQAISNEYKDRYVSKKPGKIICAGGCEFHLYKYYDEISKKEILDLPRFDETPVYTGEGRPFVLTLNDSCPFGKSNDLNSSTPDECGDCAWCCMEHPEAVIGVCMCDERKIEEARC